MLLLLTVPVQAADLRIAVASNFLGPLKTLAPLYEKESGDRLIISGGSSGKLFAQILNGAPYEFFMSADSAYPRRLIETGFAVPGSEFVYATGVLALWGRAQQPIDVTLLRAVSTRRIAMANPAIAPYGAAAQDVMKGLNISTEINKKIVQGESVGQAFQFVASGNAQLGFVALSQVLSPNNRFNREHYWIAPASGHTALAQAAVLLKQGQDNPAAKRFRDFLQDRETQQHITALGYR